jgi:Holliday junction DNA helicase RuvA
LKDKVKPGEAPASQTAASQAASETAQEAVSALVMLGFNQPASLKVVNKIVKDNAALSVEQIIKNALKML